MEIKQKDINLQIILEASPIALVLINERENIVYVNNFAENLFSYKKAELKGQALDILLPDIHRIKPPEFWQNYFINPTTFRVGPDDDVTALTKTGRGFPAEVRINPIGAEGQIYFLVAITDISERIRANEQFKLLVESALNAMILTDPSGNIAMVNKQTEVLFGYDRKELIGQKIEILVPSRMKQHHPEHRRNFHAHPKARPMGAGRDLFAVKKDGTEIPVEIGLNPIHKDGEQYVLASVIDITGRKKTEEAIKRYTHEIEEKNKELEEFTNVASHDLREPLNSIISLAELLIISKKDQLDEDGKKMLDYISKSSARMSEMITGLLEYARMGKSMNLESTNLNELVNTVLLDLDSSIIGCNAKINVAPLPTINVYPIEIRLLFQNLISNALKYRFQEVSPEIFITARQVKKGWEFSIKDNGIGIPDPQKEKIFNLFHRLHGRNKYDGTGIGLAQCRKIAELHNGRIWVESTLGEGSTFFFFIPEL